MRWWIKFSSGIHSFEIRIFIAKDKRSDINEIKLIKQREKRIEKKLIN